MLILAGITLNLTLGEHGIFKTAQNAGKTYSEQEAREKLETVLLGLQADKITKPEEYNDEYIAKELAKNNIEVSGDIVTVGDWQFTINTDTLGVEESLGKLTKEEMLLPTITKFDLTKTKNNIKVSLKLRNEENAKITYKIKKQGEENDLEKIENETNLEHTFSNLDLGKYIISIHTENEHGTDNKSKEIEVTISIDFDESNKELWVGAEKDIEYTTTPENLSTDNLKWTSSNPEIVQIDENGKIKTLKKGTAVITATLNDITATCKIEVKNNIFEDIATSGKTIEELGMSITKSSTCHVWAFNPNDMNGIYGGSWDGVRDWNWNFTVPESVVKEKGISSITAVWETRITCDYGPNSTSTVEMGIVYEDEDKQNFTASGVAKYGSNEISEHRLNCILKDKPIKNITFKAYGHDGDWAASFATLKAILY